MLAGLFIAAQGGFFLAGVRWRDSVEASGGSWQIADPYLLVHDFARTILYLHAEPPLYNVEFAFFAAIGPGPAGVVMPLVNLALGAVMFVAAYLVAIELGIGRRLAMALVALCEIAPATILYQYWQFYTFPTAVTVLLFALFVLRYLRTGRRREGYFAFGAAGALVLGNSTFQLPWLLAVVGIVLVARRSNWREVLRVAALPLVVVGGWYLKNAVLFGTYSTSSWAGLNLAKVTLGASDPSVLQRLVAERVLSPLALQQGFQPLSAYEPRFVAPARSGVRILSENMKVDPSEGPNLNNAAIIPLSSAYLHEDLKYIAHEPRLYLDSLSAALRLWFVPSDRYVFLQTNWSAISSYANAFNRYVALEPVPYGSLGSAPSWSETSLTSLGAYLVILAGIPVLVALRRRRRELPLAASAVLWMTVGYTLVVTTLVEYGENNRFRFDLGPLPAIAGVAVLCALFRAFAASPVPHDHGVATGSSELDAPSSGTSLPAGSEEEIG
jgi:hypothetical protein